jgi:hypothetical protein
MPTPIPFPPPGFDDLSTDEKIDYLALLWDRSTTPIATIDVREWHREVMTERVRHLDSDPDRGDPWDVVQTRLRERHETKR